MTSIDVKVLVMALNRTELEALRDEINNNLSPSEPAAARLQRIAREMRERAEADAVLRDREKEIAQMAVRITHRVFSADLTLNEYMQERVSEWYRAVMSWHTLTITEFLGMTVDEYADWVINGTLSDRVVRIQTQQYASRVLRGHR